MDHLICECCGVAFSTLGQNHKGARVTYLVRKPKVCSQRCHKKLWNRRNPERVKAFQSRYREANRETLREGWRDYAAKKRKADPEAARLARIADYQKHRAKRCKDVCDRVKRLRKEDPYFALVDGLRRRVWVAVKAQGTRKKIRSAELVGCSPAELRDHLEAQFQPGMTWENWGRTGWHIDHIRPCASFDLTDPEQQKECFHYTNLQPLWAAENIRKGDKWEVAA